jgi:hypothetical protein
MNKQQRIDLLVKLGYYITGGDETFTHIKEQAAYENPWFLPEFIETSVQNIGSGFLQKDKLEQWLQAYALPGGNPSPKTVGIVMAGNIPLVGFHDLLCVFITGHRALVKPSSKDTVLIKHLADKLVEWDGETVNFIAFAENLKSCDAYIATGSNNTARYFDYYFGKYPSIIRRNRTSVAVLDGRETTDELVLLADDIQLYFGLGCRNVTKLYVPEGYDFTPLLDALRKYDHLADFHKYKHNFDYHLAILIMNSKYYMNNGSIILTQHASPFSPVSQIHYEFYSDLALIMDNVLANNDIQCVVGHAGIPFGQAQSPALCDYADGIDTMAFLKDL